MKDQKQSVHQQAADSRVRATRLREAADAAKQRGQAMRVQAEESGVLARDAGERLPNIPWPEPVGGALPRRCEVCGALMPEGVGCSLCPGGDLKQSERDYSAAMDTWQVAQDAGRAAEAAYARAEGAWEQASTAWDQAQNTYATAEEAWQQAQVRHADSRAAEEQSAIQWEEAQTRRGLAQEARRPPKDATP